MRRKVHAGTTQTTDGGIGNDLVLQAQRGLIDKARHHALLDVVHCQRLQCVHQPQKSS